MKMTKKVLRCEGEGERKGEVCWEKTNRRKRTENVRMSEKSDSLFVCEQAESVFFVCLFVRYFAFLILCLYFRFNVQVEIFCRLVFFYFFISFFYGNLNPLVGGRGCGLMR